MAPNKVPTLHLFNNVSGAAERKGTSTAGAAGDEVFESAKKDFHPSEPSKPTGLGTILAGLLYDSIESPFIFG